MCSGDVKDQVGSVPGSPGYACQIHQTPIAKRQAAMHQTPQSFRVNQFTTLHQNSSRPMVVQSNTMHHSPTIGQNLPAAFLTSRPSQHQQRRDTFTDLTRGTFTDELATPQRPMLGASFMPEFVSSPAAHHQRLHHSQGNIYAEVEHDYEVDSGFTEESVDLTSESRSNRAAILRDLDHHPRGTSRSKPYLGKNPANPLYSSDDSELDQGRRQFLGRTSERRVWKQEAEPEDVGGMLLHHHERLERGRYDNKAAIQHQGVSREGHCALHSLYTVARDGL